MRLKKATREKKEGRVVIKEGERRLRKGRRGGREIEREEGRER